jgi:hypothetical protein
VIKLSLHPWQPTTKHDTREASRSIHDKVRRFEDSIFTRRWDVMKAYQGDQRLIASNGLALLHLRLI